MRASCEFHRRELPASVRARAPVFSSALAAMWNLAALPTCSTENGSLPPHLAASASQSSPNAIESEQLSSRAISTSACKAKEHVRAELAALMHRPEGAGRGGEHYLCLARNWKNALL